MKYDRDYFNSKTAVVTGAASGIGLALTEELLRCGASNVVLADINEERLDEQAKRLEGQYSGKVKAILCDVTKEERVQQLIGGAAAFCGGRIDLLISNAGALFTGWLDDLSNEDWKKAFDLDFYSALYGMRAAVPVMKKQGGGQIVNIISGTAFMPMAEWGPYATTKAALTALTMAARYEYWDDNIKISAATPGTTATNIFGNFGTPQSAQTPQQSASRILKGVVKNDRVIFGDDADAKGAKDCYAFKARKGKDWYLLRVARERKKGVNAI